MSEANSRRNGASAPGGYFFLSYAHFPPLAGSPEEHQPDPPDEWVGMFFRDLTNAVQNSASPPPPRAPGFFDQEIPLGSDWKAVLSRALGTAEVFVPLLSPDYITKSWPGREWACFERRMKSAGIREPLRRFAPVLWIPLPANQQPGGLQEALDLAPNAASSAYRENGLRALLRLAPYRRSYEMIVRQLAERVVEVAEKMPSGPSVVDIDQVESKFSRDANLAAFVIVVAAPAVPDLPEGADSVAYGPAAQAWRPFARDEQQLSLAEYAQVTAEQLGFAVDVIDIEKAKDGFSEPGVVLIDPRYLADAEGLNTFRAFAQQLQPWMLPVMVTGARAENWVRQVKILLGGSRISRSEPARRGLKGVASLREFVNLMPFLVAQAEREYLRHGPIQSCIAQAGARPRLGGHDEPSEPTAPQPRREFPAGDGSANGRADV
jgi:FxsC-like protein